MVMPSAANIQVSLFIVSHLSRFSASDLQANWNALLGAILGIFNADFNPQS
jgi:hypothetical protein